MLPESQVFPFKNSLITGQYSLLLGAGVTLDSRDRNGNFLPSGNQLKNIICEQSGVPESTSLSRAFGALDEARGKHIIESMFRDCRPGISISRLPNYLWARTFTFNVDDVIETIYETSSSKKQNVITSNFDDEFIPTAIRSSNRVIHLHGWVGKPSSGYVFSTSEYMKYAKSVNPWMSYLANAISTEPFIIAGASLDEPDLEYYIYNRNDNTVRDDRGPSLLIEPFPTVATEKDCEKYGFVLVKATFGEFLDWVHSIVPTPPSISELIVPDINNIFDCEIPTNKLIKFFSDFELVKAKRDNLPAEPTRFLIGDEPTWDDISSRIDIPRKDNQVLLEVISDMLTTDLSQSPSIICLSSPPGDGKTTVLKRVAHDLVQRGTTVLFVKTLSMIDVDNSIYCLERFNTKVVIIIDNLADHVMQVYDLISADSIQDRILVFCAERSYRAEHIETVLSGKKYRIGGMAEFSEDETVNLIRRYTDYGLIGDRYAKKNPKKYAKRIMRDSVAVKVCRILNDYKPLERIVKSLWVASDDINKLTYLCIALARYCYSVGLKYELTQKIHGSSEPLWKLLKDSPLQIRFNSISDNYLVPYKTVIGDSIVRYAKSSANGMLFEAFMLIAENIAPHVNRQTIIRRTPEARLASRLFDADTVVRPLLGKEADKFYLKIEKDWKWNSRYWEQRALLKMDTDIDIAVQYAKHAVTIEMHPFPLTTLGRTLLKKLEMENCSNIELFAEAFHNLKKAIDIEHSRSKVTVHPFSVLLNGIYLILSNGVRIPDTIKKDVQRYIEEARNRYADDKMIKASLIKIDSMTLSD